MLHGIGGSSIEEAKENLSADEAARWAEYIRRRGSLNWGMRLERGFALIASILVQAHGGRASMDDFTPHADQQEATLDDVMQLMGGKR